MIPKYPSIALLALIIAIATSYFFHKSKAVEKSWQTNSASDINEIENKPDAGSWHDKYVADHCERCPDCCVTINHCEGCPGPKCDCIKTTNGDWVLSPETGDPE